ncbi:hypothetical protein Ppa06_26410 [Planomonospora parontospora subsp. parontospora]|uniref:HTH cro/C1-type domain-containing protein n=2 Tax=Planomonospora parontospora TaxID=58119 RepID=A0AA37F3S6_9ACTN|nr:helix-turn-helix transcriptional regulator [Planomonospora parontospora]GGK59865.1 hypothetical protein GCM10010126_19270 [Planomonospora parontospora]GII08843.1 hypothetical protein Ppa06_26410 [Planomonospora parontospora subsp. parontospora]
MSPRISTTSKLRQWRTQNSLTLEDVSGLCGLSVATVSRVERGKSNLAPIMKVKVARRLGARVRDLFDIEDVPETADVA